MSKGQLRIEDLTLEQRAALAQFQRDAQQAMPKIMELTKAAQAAFATVRDAPTWKFSETPQPQEVSEPKMWTVGHAQVNYVDKIELKDEGTQDK